MHLKLWLEENVFSKYKKPTKSSIEYQIKKNIEILLEFEKKPGRSLIEKVFLVSCGLDEIPLCEGCHCKPKVFISFQKGYRKCCSNECAQIVKKETCLKRYGSSSFLSSDKCSEIRKKQNLEKYGVPFYSQSEEYRNKVRETSLKRYGTESPNQSEKVKENKRKTCLEKYGKDFYLQTDEFRKRVEVSNLEKYGVKCSLQNSDVRRKGEETCLEKYGVRSSNQSCEVKEKIKRSHRRNGYEKFKIGLLAKQIELASSLEDYVSKNSFEFKCLACRKNVLFRENKLSRCVLWMSKKCFK